MRVIAACLLAVLLAACGARKATVAPPATAGPLLACKITDQDVRVNFSGSDIRIQASYQLQNTGEAPIEELRVSLRQVNSLAAYDMRLNIDGAEVPWTRFEGAGDRGMRAAVPGGWRPQQSRIVILTYAFRSGFQAAGGTGFSETFQLFPGAWSPILLSAYPASSVPVEPPAKWSLSVVVPDDILVHASGEGRGTTTRDAQTEHRFEQSGANLTFVMAGRYREDVVSAEGFNVHFWSSHRAPADARIESVSRRIAAGLRALSAELGPREVSPQSVWVVFPGGMRYIMAAPGVTVAGIAPDVILDTGLLADPTTETICHTDELLAALWLAWYPRPEPKAAILGEQLAKHVAQTYPGGCGYSRYRAQGRNEAVRAVLEMHADRSKAAAAAERAAVREGMKYEIQSLAMRLFVFALEDAVGREKLLAAARQMLHAQRNGSWSAETLRLALEAQSRRKLAPLFKQWLDVPGIPTEFVARYGASAPANAQSKP